jgi:DNA primase
MGSTLSDLQATLLVENCEAVTLMLDGDEPRQEATAKISARLIHQMYVKIAPLVGGLRPDQLSPEHIKTLLGPI